MNRHRTAATALLIAALLAGCATERPPMSEADWNRMVSRDYPGKSAKQVLDAAEQLWRLSGGKRFTIEHGDSGLTATRHWQNYEPMVLITGVDDWTLDVTEAGGATHAKVSIRTSQRHTTASLLGMTPATHTGPRVGGEVQGTSIYDLFWARMDYLLGVRSDWMSCAASDGQVSTGATWGQNDALCNGLNLPDESPKPAQ